MKKMLLASLAIFILIPGMLAGEETVKILPMELPADPAAAANTILITLSRLQALGEELAANMPAVDITLYNAQGSPLVNLGAFKKGKLKWDHKTFQDKFLAVKFAAADYALLAESIKARTPQPGYQIAVCDAITQAVIKSYAVTFSDFADLAVQLNYPVKAAPGQALGQEVSVNLENKGSVAAKNIKLEIVLSGDDLIPRRSAPASAAFVEDMLLQNGSETIPVLEAGQQTTVTFSGSLKLPDDTPPGKHYLAVVADPENSIGELSEDNNISQGYIMIEVPEPAAFALEMPETVLHFEPATYGFKIICFDTLLSDGKDWKLCKMKPNVYQIKHVSWGDFFWEIDTYEKAVWEISGVAFCKKGGKARDLNIKVEVAGGSLLTPPSRFTLKLASTRMRFEPATKKFALLAYEKPICHLPFWWVCKRESYLFQIRYVLWQDFFWQVDTFKKEAGKISGGKFCSTGASAEKLPAQVTVEK
jgi:hypothetical protein